MGIVTSKEIAKVIGLERFGIAGTFTGWLLMKILRISAINKIYDKNKNKSDLEFLNGVLNDCKIEFEIPEEDLKRIPKDGPFITISNHPLGGIDGVLLLKLLIEKRADYKIIANFLLHRIEPLKPYIMPVNPFETRKDAKSSVAGIKSALIHLREGKPLGIFPAGEVSTYRDGKLMVDKPWEDGAVRLIKKAKVPVIPIYFHAKNSQLFYILSKISGTLRTAKLPSEVISQKNRVIKVRIGKPISVKDQEQYKDVPSFYEFIRKKTYMLANPFEKTSQNILSPQNLKIPKKAKKIISQKSPDLFLKEVDDLRDKGSRLLESKNYEVFFANAKEIPNILHEIGRLREITFRDVGEGTNKPIDLDKFDRYYHHLFLWDNVKNELVGAYRMGLGKDIFKKYGINGFYVHTLFRIEPELYAMMQNTIELGRAFIAKNYQQKPMPLFLLWKGIVHVTLRYPKYKYLMGGVSISNQFSDFSAISRSHNPKPWAGNIDVANFQNKIKIEGRDSVVIKDTPKNITHAVSGQANTELSAERSIRRHRKERYKLLPYIYSTAYENYLTGMPICRPMLIAFPEDYLCFSDTWSYQYMFGSNILVAPVYGDFKTMEIYLPRENDWIDYWSKEVYKGGGIISYNTEDVEKLPLFIKAGAILPKTSERNWIEEEKQEEKLILDIYPAEGKTSFTLYEDDGKTITYQNGAYSSIVISQNQTKVGELIITIDEAKGDFKNKLPSRVWQVRVFDILNVYNSVSINGKKEKIKTNSSSDKTDLKNAFKEPLKPTSFFTFSISNNILATSFKPRL